MAPWPFRCSITLPWSWPLPKQDTTNEQGHENGGEVQFLQAWEKQKHRGKQEQKDDGGKQDDKAPELHVRQSANPSMAACIICLSAVIIMIESGLVVAHHLTAKLLLLATTPWAQKVQVVGTFGSR